MRIDIKQTFAENALSFLKHIRFFGGNFCDWYVGITVDPKRSFLEIHGLDLLEKEWLLGEECFTPKAVFLKNFLISMGCRNNNELDLVNSNNRRLHVYLFKMGL